MSVDTIRLQFEKHGQSHVFAQWDSLSATERETLLNDAKNIPIDRVKDIFVDSMKGHAEALNPTGPNEISPFPPEHIASTDDSDVNKWRSLGLQLVAEGKCATVVMAGGQGTRLGSPLPKGLLGIDLPSKKTLFQLFAERIRKVEQLAKAAAPSSSSKATVPFLIMTSESTHDVIVQYFEQNAFLGLDKANVFFFKQGFLPAMTRDGKIIMQTTSRISIAPDGNGGIFGALESSGMLSMLESRGVEQVQVFSVDNILAKVADPVFYGFCAAKGADCAAKTVVKAGPEEKVGVFALRNGRSGVIEYSEIGAERSKLRHSTTNELLFNDGNIAVHMFSVDFLKQLVKDHLKSLVYHVAEKSIPSVSGPVDGVKFEAFIFDVFQFGRSFHLLRVPREAEFAPIKNASAPGKPDTPDTARRLVCALHAGWIAQAGGQIESSSASTCCNDSSVPLVEVSPLVSYEGEGLSTLCQGKKFTAPLYLSS